MKIGIIGNMNNSYFSLARYLRDQGYDCELLIYKNEPAHFDPSCDTNSNKYKTYCKKLSWGDPADFLKQDFDIVKKDIETYDFLIGNGPAPAYVSKIGRRLDIFMPYGYDLYSLPFLKLVHPLRLLAYVAAGRFQRKGIKNSLYIFFDRTNKEFETIFKKLQYQGSRIVCTAPMLYHKDYENGWQNYNAVDPLLDSVKKMREENEILLVQHTRQIWKKSPDYWSNKGNDLLIKGFSKFLKQYPHTKAKLILFEYGENVDDTKKLIEEFQLTDFVTWLPKMPRNKLMHILMESDLIIGELYHSWFTYGVALEALSLGKPLMHKRNDVEFTDDYTELYPMLHASSVDSVFAGLAEVLKNKNEMKQMGAKGKEWFLKYGVQHPLDEIKKIIKEKENA